MLNHLKSEKNIKVAF